MTTHFAPEQPGGASVHMSVEYRFPDETLRARTIEPEFFNRRADEVARDLLGKKLFTLLGGKATSGLIIETQAYTGASDPDSHPYRGAMSKQIDWKPGSLYVYAIQGHPILTFATPPYNEGACVLVRALHPLEGIRDMEVRRGTKGADLLKGPARVSTALGITTDANGRNIFDCPSGTAISLEYGIPVEGSEIQATPRQRSKAPELHLRFVLTNKLISSF